MGLREKKARRTRETIGATAWDLFERQGYDATPMEQIAEVAEVAPTTLYRYYPTKDSLLVEHLMPVYGRLSLTLRERPSTESLEVALGIALHDHLLRAEEDADRLLRLRALIDGVPAARARVWDSWYQETEMLEQAIAERAGVAADELWVQLTARATMTVLQMSLDAMRGSEPRPVIAHAEEIIRVTSSSAAVIPELPRS